MKPRILTISFLLQCWMRAIGQAEDLKAIMKFILFTMIMFSSCDNEEESNPLVGTWALIQFETHCDDPPRNEVQICTMDCIELTFTKDGRVIRALPIGLGWEARGTYIISGNKLTLNFTGWGIVAEYAYYSISGNKLRLRENPDPCGLSETYIKS